MITLHVYLTPHTGKAGQLEAEIRDRWLAAMARQPGFVSAAVLTPLPDSELRKIGARKPESVYEVVAFWRSEVERMEWVARPIHDEVFKPVMQLASNLSFSVQNVKDAWRI